MDVFAVDVLSCGGGGWGALPAGGVLLLEAVQFEARLEFGEEAHAEGAAGWK
jgi:hypothetical protein